MKGRSGHVSDVSVGWIGRSAYDLLQSLCGTKTSWAGTDDENIDVARDLGQHGIQCADCVEGVAYISLPLALLRLRWWVLGPLASLEGVLGMVKRCGWCNGDVYYAPGTVQWRCEEREGWWWWW
jgi:hypothetical protein